MSMAGQESTIAALYSLDVLSVRLTRVLVTFACAIT